MTQCSSGITARQQTGYPTYNAVHMHLVLTKDSDVDASQHIFIAGCVKTIGCLMQKAYLICECR